MKRNSFFYVFRIVQVIGPWSSDPTRLILWTFERRLVCSNR
jgi:hypothetical protein